MGFLPDFEISLNDASEQVSLADAAKCAEVLQNLATCEQADFSIEHKEGYVLIVLLTPQRAYMMWMKEEGDEGQHAIDESANDDEGQRHRFVLANGQVDEFSGYDTVSRELALQAVSHFIQTRAPSPNLKWIVP